MRLDHLLSREEVGVVLLLICEGRSRCLRKHVEEERQRERGRAAGDDAQHSRRGHRGKKSGGDALMGNTRSHPEHVAHAGRGVG